MTFGPDGALLGTYSKVNLFVLGKYNYEGVMHLFRLISDVNVSGTVFNESAIFSHGKKLLTIDTGLPHVSPTLLVPWLGGYTDWCKVGIGICYDFRFPELASLYALRGNATMTVCMELIMTVCMELISVTDCRLLLYPCALNSTLSSQHAELLLRSL